MKQTTSGVPQAPFFVPMLNPLIKRLLMMGLPFGPMILLTVRGRKSGQPHTTPVGIFHREGHEYLFGTFGDVNWVRNLRAAGTATLARGRRERVVSAVELPREDTALVLRDVVAPYLKMSLAGLVTRPYFVVPPHATMAYFIAEAGRHPIFEVRPQRAEPAEPVRQESGAAREVA